MVPITSTGVTLYTACTMLARFTASYLALIETLRLSYFALIIWQTTSIYSDSYTDNLLYAIGLSLPTSSTCTKTTPAIKMLLSIRQYWKPSRSKGMSWTSFPFMRLMWNLSTLMTPLQTLIARTKSSLWSHIWSSMNENLISYDISYPVRFRFMIPWKLNFYSKLY
jgi:hypothetical protein